jgi:phosphatidylserine decarboxylase
MMKFGSRMDIHLPIGSQINVKIGDKVKAGVTFLAIIG